MGQERHDDAHQVVTAKRPSIGSSGLRLGDWWRHSDVHILLVAAGWILGSSALLNRTVAWPFLLLACVGAFLVYRVDRLFVHSPEDVVNANERVGFTVQYRVVLVAIAVVMTFAAAWAAFHLELAWMEVSLAVGMLGLVYPLRILPGGRRPKDILWLKTLLIAGCWVGGGVLLPALMPGQGEPVDVAALALVGIYRTLFVLPNLWVADWLDRVGDSEAGVLGWGGNVQEGWLAAVLCAGVIVVVVMGFARIQPELLVIDGLAFVGMVLHAWRIRRQGQGSMTLLDLWVAFPFVTWILRIVLAVN